MGDTALSEDTPLPMLLPLWFTLPLPTTPLLLPMLLPLWFTPPLPTTPLLWPTPPLLTVLPRSTLTRSPPTHTTMPSLTTTPTPTSTLLSLATEPARLKALTPWLFLTAAPSMSTTM